MTGEDYEAAKDEQRPDWPGYRQDGSDTGTIVHLPECTDSDSPWWREFKARNPHMEFAGCICDRLRACEARVMASDEPWAKASAAANVESYDEGFAAGLSAARDAVAALPWTPTFTDLWVIDKADALAAIDALAKEKP